MQDRQEVIDVNAPGDRPALTLPLDPPGKAAARTLLIVDDETPFLLSFRDGLNAYASNLNVLTAENGLEAIRVLETAPIDLVVTDLKMPEMDGFQLLIHITRHWPEVPVIVMTAFGTPEISDRIRSMGAPQLVEKPLNFEVLAQKIFQELSAAAEGKLQGVTLPGFLQLVSLEKKSCVLKVRSGERAGVFFVRQGELQDARTRDLAGEAAAVEMATWDDAEITLGPLPKECRATIRASVNQVLMEAFRIKDEKEERGEKAGASGAGDGSAARGALPEALPSPETKEEKMAGLKELLAELARMQGVAAVCLVGCDGFLIESVLNGKMEAEMVGAIASSGFGASESIGRELGKGRLEMTMLEFESGPVILSPVGSEFFLVLVASKEASLGMMRMKIRKLTQQIEASALA